MPSPTNTRRAELIREMAADLNRTRQSLGSNSDFDITGSQLSIEDGYSDNSRPLPNLRNDNQHSGKIVSRRSPDFAIDTSAIVRAFPDMTGSGSEIDDGSSISIEIGRGLRNGTKNLSDDGDSKNSLGLGEKYKVDLNKLSRKPRNSGRDALRDLSTNVESIRSSPPPMKATRYGTSGSSGRSSVNDGRAPVPKVTVEDADNSQRIGGKLPAQDVPRNSNQPKDNLPLPKRFTSAKDLLQGFDGPTARANAGHRISKAPVDNPTITSNGGTVQSFMLPNMPNMSELVSGIYDDGASVFSRRGSSRFQARPPKSPAVRHAAVPNVPVPMDEEAIVMSLRLLQEKVAELERNKAEAQIVIKELRDRIRGSEVERKAQRQSIERDTSGAGSSAGSDAGSEGPTETGRTVAERTRLQNQLQNLKHELDGANRRAAVAEASVDNITQERDAAVSQLGIAFVVQEELKVDNEALKEDNKRLELEVRKYRAAIEAYIQREEDRTETTSKGKATVEDGSGQETRSVDCQVLDVETPKRPKSRRDVSRTIERDNEPPAQASIEIPKRRKRRVVVEEYTITSELDGATGNQDDQETQEHTNQNTTRNRSRNASRSLSNQERPVSRSQSVKNIAQALQDATQGSHVSFLQNSDVTMLRKMLEREHLVKKGRLPGQDGTRGTDNDAATNGDITQLTQHTSHSRRLPRKSSMKDLSGRISVGVEDALYSDDEHDEQTHHSREPSQCRRRHSDASAATGKASQGRVPAMDDLTSALILPDFTMNVRSRRPSQANADLTGNASIDVPEIMVNGAPHEPTNCTICTRILGQCNHDETGKIIEVKIPQPIPASDRIHDLAQDGDDHTTRPSEPPAQALARTIKALEDEFAHLGLQISEQQRQYNDLDPSMQKRKRKSLNEQIQKLHNMQDSKADQIYALYDVLEGQKKSGKLDNMTADELNETLTSVLGDEADMAHLGMPTGIMFKRGQKTSTADVTPAKERAKPRKMSVGEKADKAGARPNGKFPWDESYENEDAESLPWEGFDDTIDMTTGSRRSNTSSRRRSTGL